MEDIKKYGGHDDELIDKVDRNDVVVGAMLRSQKGETSNYRVVNAFIIRDDNKVFIPRRSLNKKSFAGAYDFSVGGYVKSGESYIDALLREVKEEVNINAGMYKTSELLYLSPFTSNVSSFMKVYLINWNDDIVYNKSDFCESIWVTFSEMESKFSKEGNSKTDLLKVINIIKSRNLTISLT